MSAAVAAPGSHSSQDGLRTFFRSKVDELEMTVRLRQQNLRRLQAQRNELNQRGAGRADAHDAPFRGARALGPRGRAERSRGAAFAVRALRDELALLQEPGSHVGEVVKVMGKEKVLVKVRGAGGGGRGAVGGRRAAATLVLRR